MNAAKIKVRSCAPVHLSQGVSSAGVCVLSRRIQHTHVLTHWQKRPAMRECILCVHVHQGVCYFCVFLQD